ncbi:hypothetical protein [Kitasatospora azatica]|uniref:hypothetical protein n=1 Tax=Kitasatospora azatica TaxID=58347 RepID=UPI000A7CACD7|nr:hypothetical protein [Kitasatospora azatica]
MQPPNSDDPRHARFIRDCLSTGIPLAEAQAMLAAHQRRDVTHPALSGVEDAGQGEEL